MNQNKKIKKKGIAKKAISVSLVAAMLATTNIPVWANPIVEDADTPVVDRSVEDANTNLLSDSVFNNTLSIAPLEWSDKVALTGTLELSGAAVINDINYWWTRDGYEIPNSRITNSTLTDLMNDTYTTVEADCGHALGLTIQILYDNGGVIETLTVPAVPVAKQTITGTMTVQAAAYNGGVPQGAIQAVNVTDPVGSGLTTNDFDFTFTAADGGSLVNVGDDVNVDGKVKDSNKLYAGSLAQESFTVTDRAYEEGDLSVDFKDGKASTEYTGIALAPAKEDVEITDTLSGQKIEDADAVTNVTLDRASVDAGEYTATAELDGTKLTNFSATPASLETKTKYTIGPRNLGDCTIQLVADEFPYDADTTKQNLQIKSITDKDGNVYDNATLLGQLLVEVPESKAIKEYTATVKPISGTKNVTGSQTVKFNVVSASEKLSDYGFETGAGTTGADYAEDDEQYTGSAVTKDVKKLGDLKKTADGTVLDPSNYEITYKNNTNAGEATLVVNGLKSYAGQKITYNFDIKQATLNPAKAANATIDYNASYSNAADYNMPLKITGKNAAAPAKTFTLEKDKDFTVKYEFVRVGPNKLADNSIGNKIKATITLIGDAKTNFDTTGVDLTAETTIAEKSIKGAVISYKQDYEYTGKGIEPEFTVTSNGTTLHDKVDYTYKVTNNINAGKATVTITGTGDYRDSMTFNFNIIAVPASKLSVALKTGEEFTYSGEVQKPRLNQLTIKLGDVVLDPDDFKISYPADQTDNINAGKTAGSLTIQPLTSNKNITGSKDATFEIKPFALEGELLAYNADGTLVVDTANRVAPDYNFDGKEKTFAKVKFVPDNLGDKMQFADSDYEVKYVDNLMPGNAFLYVKPVNPNYTAVNTIPGQDGTIITGVAAAAGFLIRSVSLELANITVKNPEYAAGLPVKPEVKVTLGTTTLRENIDYILVYPNASAVTVGNPYEVVAQAIEPFSGSTAVVNWGIVAKDLKNITVKLDKSSYKPGEKPEVTVMNGDRILLERRDYTVEYTGQGVLTIKTGTSTNYTGSQTVYYKVDTGAPAAPKNLTAVTNTTAIKVSWDAVADADGYVVYEYAKSDLKTITKRHVVSGTSKLISGYNPGTVRTFVVRAYKKVNGKNVYCTAASAIANKISAATKPNKTNIKSITTGKNIAKVYTTVGKGAAGAAYCVSYDGGKTYSIVAKGPKGIVGSTNYTMRGLKSGKATIRIRGYVKDHSGKTIYGDWSKAVNVTIK